MAPYSRTQESLSQPQAGSAASAPDIAPKPALLPHRVQRAMSRFACIAEGCEDTCCKDWGISIDRPDLERLRGAMSLAPGGSQRLVRLVVIGRASQEAKDAAAHIGMDENGACPELDVAGRCRTHIDFGEQALPKPCSVFPRTSLATHEALEVGGSLACPEMARLTLLDPQALDFLPTAPEILPRTFVGKTIDADAGNAYVRYFLPVRGALLKILGARQFSLPTRLVAAAQMADTLGAFYFQGTTAFAGREAAFCEHRLFDALADGVREQTLRGVEQDLAAVTVPPGPVAGMVAGLLLGRKALAHPPRFGDLLRQVFENYQAKVFGRPALASDSVTPDQLAAVYMQERTATDALFGDEVSLVFGNFCQHYVLRNPFVETASLLDSLGMMVLELAALRLLFTGHPHVAAAQAMHVPTARPAVYAAAVQVVQTYAKAVSHHPGFRDTLARAVGGGGAPTLSTLVMLAKFV